MNVVVQSWFWFQCFDSSLILGIKTLLKAVNKELQSWSKSGTEACVIAISVQVNITVGFRGGALLWAGLSHFFHAVFQENLDKL